MSSFIVTNKHINSLVSWASNKNVQYYWQGQWYPIRTREKSVAKVLLDENVRSVRYNYGEGEAKSKFKHESDALYLSAIQIAKACDCLSYQSCDTSDWKQTEAFAIVDAIRDEAIRSVPGYDAAQWALA